MSGLLSVYKTVAIPKLKQELGYSSVMQLPKIEKITLSIGVGEAIENKKFLDAAFSDLTAISGQKPVITLARKSVAGFKLRSGMPIGCMVTLRKAKMYDFLERFINLAVPAIRDFRGFTVRAFDANGNISVGIKEQIIFREISYEKIDKLRGLNVTITIKNSDVYDSYLLLKTLGFPFRDELKPTSDKKVRSKG